MHVSIPSEVHEVNVERGILDLLEECDESGLCSGEQG